MAVSKAGEAVLPSAGYRGESRLRRVARWNGEALSGRLVIYELRLLVVAAFLACWQYLPEVEWISSRYRFLDRFFISSPQRVWNRFWDYAFGTAPFPSIWPALFDTVSAALEGFLIGSVLGFAVGLVLSNSDRLYDIFGIFLIGLNSVPKVAILPIIVVIVGIGRPTVVVSSAMVVFFITFFNSLEGGRSVPAAVFDNARVYGASPLILMGRIRARYVLLWAFASLPNAVAYSIHAAVTVQILAGSGGIGGMIQNSVAFLDATGAITLAVYLGITGLVLLRAAEYVKRRVLHWADSQAQVGT